MTEKDKVKMAVVAGAAAAFDYKENHPSATESEVMGYVTKKMVKIIRDLEEEF